MVRTKKKALQSLKTWSKYRGKVGQKMLFEKWNNPVSTSTTTAVANVPV